MFKKIAIVNRGEIAMRILHAANELGIQVVALHSDIDANLLHVKHSDSAFCIGGSGVKDSYLDYESISRAIRTTNCDAVHPGYGFVAEKPDFIRMLEKQDISFIGPSALIVEMMEDKILSRRVMNAQGLKCVPGQYEPITDYDSKTIELAEKVGFPLVVKAAKGGGGRAMETVFSEEKLEQTIKSVQTKSKQEFDDCKVYFERYMRNPRHIELQVIADQFGNVVHMGMRDCSTQHWNKKVIEESPPPNISVEAYMKVAEKCVQICKNINYIGVGTFEFLYVDGEFYFLEMNTRIQVGHSVTEMVTDIDLVKEQINIAAGNKLSFKQDDIVFHGNSIECRIYAEDPSTFEPSFGKITDLHTPGGPGIRIDSHLYVGYEVPEMYDRLVLKITACSDSREHAINRMVFALQETLIKGIKTNIPFVLAILSDPRFLKGNFTGAILDSTVPDL